MDKQFQLIESNGKYGLIGSSNPYNGPIDQVELLKLINLLENWTGVKELRKCKISNRLFRIFINI